MINEALQYVRNTGGGATKEIFIEDHEPIGEMLWADLVAKGWVEVIDGKIFSTAKAPL